MNFFKRLFGKSDRQAEPDYYGETDSASGHTEALEKTVFPDQDPLPAKAPERVENAVESSPVRVNSPELFSEELYDSLNRYYSAPELQIDLDLKDGEGTRLAAHEAFNGTFGEWQNIQSAWDRRSVLFALWDQTEFNKLRKWQIVERFVKDRAAMDAVQFQKENISADDFQDIRLIIALSRLYSVLDSPPTAMRYAKGAYELRPDLDIAKVEYANVLHLSGSAEDKELAHSLMNEVIEKKIAAADSGREVPLLNYFMFAPGYIDSPVFAASFLWAGNSDAEAWNRLAEEYYWSPEFRYEHAVFLSKNGEPFKAMAKLKVLADEFPWYKKGVLAAMDAIQRLRTQSNDQTVMGPELARMLQYQAMWNS